MVQIQRKYISLRAQPYVSCTINLTELGGLSKSRVGAIKGGVSRCLGVSRLGDFLLCKSYEWCTRHLEQTGTAVEQFERPILNHWQYFET